jgi:type III restriction enzyme
MDKGAHYYCCDFQVHTPRDIDWNGNRAVTPEDRQQYSKDFVKKCRELGLNAIAITDHHDFAFFPYIKSAAKNETDENGVIYAEDKQLIVFPGIEMTLSTPACQAILILDSDFPEGNLVQILHFLSITPTPETDGTTAVTIPISNSIINGFDDLYDKLNKIELIKGKYIVLPNMSEGGRHTLFRAGNSEHYRKMPCVGGYVDGSISQHGTGNKNIVNGIDSKWGNKVVGILQTSDNRHRDFSVLGTHKSWIKWSIPSAEALRQACLARESRLSNSLPQIPSIVIMQLDVTNSKFLGSFSINFNSQYNSIIGGRGTGKSTILEYIRWTLCDQTASSNDPEEQSEIERKRNSIIEGTLKSVGGESRVIFSVNGIIHIIKRGSMTGEVFLKIGESDFIKARDEEIRKILPIQAYSQKQLSSVGISISELKRFIEQPILRQLASINENLEECAKKTKINYNNLIRKLGIEKEIRQFSLELTSLTAQVSKLREGLTGISKADQDIIAKKVKYENENSILEQKMNEMKIVKERINEAINSINNYPEDVDEKIDVENKEDLAKLIQATDKTIKSIKGKLTIITNDYNEVESKEIEAIINILSSKRDSFNTLYEDAKKRTSSNQNQLTEIKRIETRISEINSILREKGNILKEIGNPEVDFDTIRKQWYELQDERIKLLGEQAKLFTDQSIGFIKAEIGSNIDILKIKELLTTIFSGTRIREDKIINLCDKIKGASVPIVFWDLIIEELRKIFEYTITSTENAEKPLTPILNDSDFNDVNKERIIETIDAESWLELATTQIEYIPVFKYIVNRDLGDEILFSDASAGQQATALLSVLLNQQGAPLLIDQPEDDIDNRATDEIINSIWTAKQKRQLIFTSHNANLVVNGDSELVVCCDYKDAGSQTRGIIKYEGAIDIPKVKEEITSVMEGGEKAFILRKNKYGF